MKIVQVGDNDLHGRRFNGHDLAAALRQQGHEAEHLVWQKFSNDPHTHRLGEGLANRQTLQQDAAWLEQHYAMPAMFQPFLADLFFRPVFLDADVVHLHLLHNAFAALNHLPMLSDIKPTVWTLHDPWALTGHCVHPFDCERWKTGCGQCPDLTLPYPIGRDTTAMNWQAKRRIYAQCDLDVIVASTWMQRCVEQSPLFARARVHRVPFGVDLERFCPADSAAARRRLGIPADHRVLACRTARGDFKGLDHLQHLLGHLAAEPMTIITLGEKGLLRAPGSRITHLETGWVHDVDRLVDVYTAADLFLMPSQAESFGMMAIEAMACGTVVVGMGGTALEETLCPQQGGGVIVPRKDQDAFVAAVQNLLADPSQREAIADRARALACEQYALEHHLAGVLSVYQQAIQRKPADPQTRRIIQDLRAQAAVQTAPPSVAAGATSPALQYWLRLYEMLAGNRLARWVYHRWVKPLLNRLR
jgi:glycosyltransferase involved in cell wall biosynthesis